MTDMMSYITLRGRWCEVYFCKCARLSYDTKNTLRESIDFIGSATKVPNENVVRFP